MINRIVFAAGGTGGHIYPAIAVADELKKMNKDIKIKFIGAKGRIEEKIVPGNGYELETIEIQGFSRKLSPKNINVAFKFLNASRRAKSFLKDYKPEIVFGTGGFVSGPVLWSASQLKIPTVIQEGNSYPGITVKWLSPKVNKVIVNFEGTKQYLKKLDNIEVMSYPVRQNMKRILKNEALKIFGLDDSRKTLFVFGGSQGANSINLAVNKCLGHLLARGIQIIWQTGEKDFERLNKEAGLSPFVKLFKYIDNIDTAYSACDLVVCRSGISTIMELAGFGVAAVFVPFPGASENHQEKNARTLADKNAAKLILDTELDEKLEAGINSLIHNETELEQMRNNIKQFSDINAASKIAQMLLKMVN